MIRSPLIATLAAVLVVPAAFATAYTDFDQIGSIATTSTPVTGQFDLTLPLGENDSATMSGYVNGNGYYSDISGFTPGMAINNAAISFWLSDPAGGKESWAATITAVDNEELWEVLTAGGSFSTHFQATDISDYAELLLSISETGKLDYRISSTAGSFRVDAAMLEVNTAAVPDGGATAALLGLGFLSLAALARKRL